jgi:hypothetical protein
MFLEAINQCFKSGRAAAVIFWANTGIYGSKTPSKTSAGLHPASATAVPADRGDSGRSVLKGCSSRARLGSISANLLMPAWGSHWPKYVEGCERAGRPANTANWRVAKSVFVAKDAATAKAYATDPNGPYVYYYRSLFTKLKRGGRIELFKTRRDQPDHEVTLESICDKLIIHGTPESVADQLFAFQEETGPFGTLLYAGKDWKDRELGRRSMILMAEKVMPRVNAGTSDRFKAAE